MKKNNVTKVLSMKALMAAALLMGACSNDADNAAQSSAEYDPESKASVNWTAILHAPSPPSGDVLTKLEEHTNADINFNWVPDASKEERITAALASGELSDIVSLTMMTNSSVRQSLKSGMFWDVGEYLDDYDNLKAISQEVRDAASIEGVLYGVPYQKPLARSGLVLRQDWLDNLGMKQPTNLEELREVARAFTEDDPDGNGKDDTVGFGDRSDLRYSSFKLLASYHGAPNGWKVEEDGSFTPEFETEEYMNTMKYSRDLYENGFLSQDFAVTAKTDQQQKFAQGKTGIYTGMIDILNLKNLSQGLQDGLKLVPVNKIAGPDGEYHVWSENTGVGGLMAFPKSEVESEAELKRLLQFVNDLIDEEAFMLMTGGIEGTHYELNESGAIEITDTDLWQKEVQPLSSSRPSEITHSLVDADPDKQLANELVEENTEFAVIDPTVPLDSATANERGTELEKIMVDATIKYIMGEMDDAGFKESIEKWRSSGGDQIAKEYAEAYKASK